jgi:hypothetical protein
LKLFPAVVAILLAALLTGCAGLQGKGREAEYNQTITVLKPIEGVSIIVNYQGGVFYRVLVNNELPVAISLKWDESTYVNTGGESVRLVRIQDRNNLPTQVYLPQAASPIAPGAHLKADFIGESWMEFARSGATPKPKDASRRARIYLAFNIKGKRVDWRGEIMFTPRKPS